MFVSSEQRLLRLLVMARPSIVPASAGGVVFLASVLPWLNDPLGGHASAWNISVDIGWQYRSSMLNYGVLCCCCALFTFFIAYVHWRTMHTGKPLAYGHILYVLAGVQCLALIALFFFQYTFADLHSISRLAQHEIQARLITQCFGYNISDQRISTNPFNLPISSLHSRFVLIINQFSYGLLVPLISSWILLNYQRLTGSKAPIRNFSAREKTTRRLWLTGSLSLAFLGLGLLGRAPAAYVSQYYARTLLATGNYSQALVWLERAHALNPALDKLSYYHVDRGQARYYLRPDQVSDESRLYLAFTYRSQGKPEDAYLQLMPTIEKRQVPNWIIGEMSLNLAELADVSPAPDLATSPKVVDASRALPWLELLIQVDSSNVYAHFAVGYINYALHDYDRAIAEMQRVIQLSTSSEIRSSAYTYIGLSEGERGNDADARAYLLKAVALDPNYYNDTAREELSGQN